MLFHKPFSFWLGPGLLLEHENLREQSLHVVNSSEMRIDFSQRKSK